MDPNEAQTGLKLINILLAISLVLANVVYVSQALEQYWLIGFGGEQMLPFLDGGILTARVGERLVVKLMGRNGYLTLTSPQGFIMDRVFIQDGVPKVLKKFTAADVGEWILSTDNGLKLIVFVEQPVFKPSVTVSVALEGSEIVMSVSSPPQTYSFFLETESDNTTFTPGSMIQIVFENLNMSLLRFDLLKKADRLKYGGSFQGTPYVVELDQIVMSQIVQGRRRGGVISFTAALPDVENAGPSGLRVLNYGQHIIRLVSLGDNKVVSEGEITIVPEKLTSLKGLAKTIRTDFWEAFNKNYTLVVGDELGNIWSLVFRPPLAVFKVFDTLHSQQVEEYNLLLDGSSRYKKGEQTLLAFETSLTIKGYDNGSFIKPSRIAGIRLGFDVAAVDVAPFELRPGESFTVNVNLNRLVISLVYPNGTPYHGPRTVEINGVPFTDKSERSFLLPSETYVIYAVKPESFSSTTYTLSSDTTITIIVLDNPAALASLRVSAILMMALLGYSAYMFWTTRKSFYQARSK